MCDDKPTAEEKKACMEEMRKKRMEECMKLDGDKKQECMDKMKKRDDGRPDGKPGMDGKGGMCDDKETDEEKKACMEAMRKKRMEECMKLEGDKKQECMDKMKKPDGKPGMDGKGGMCDDKKTAEEKKACMEE